MKWISIASLAILLLGFKEISGQVASRRTDVRSKQSATAGDSDVKRALALEQQGKIPEAKAAWAIVVKAKPRNAQAYAHLGLLEARQERYPQAVVDYRKALAIDPTIPKLNLDLGLALFKQSSFQEAVKAFKAELGKNPLRPDVQRLTILVGMSYYGEHEYATAVPYLKDASAADPQSMTLLLTLAHCYLWTKQFDATMEVYKQILAIDPNSAEADMIAGEALDEKGDNAGAVQQFEAAVEANPKEPNVHFGLAYLLWVQKRWDEAIPEFNAELENDPQNSQAMIYLGDTYVQKTQYEEARPILEKAESYKANVALIHLDLGIVRMETGDQDGAIKEFTKTLALEPDNVAAHFRLATLYRGLGRKEEARAEFAKASTLNRKSDEGLYRRIAEAAERSEPMPSRKAAEPSDVPKR